MTKDKKQFIIEQFIVLLLLSIMILAAYYDSFNMIPIFFALLVIQFFVFHFLKTKGKWFKHEEFKYKKFSFIRWAAAIIMVINLFLMTYLPEANWRQSAVFVSLLTVLLLTMFLTYRFNFKTQTN